MCRRRPGWFCLSGLGSMGRNNLAVGLLLGTTLLMV